MFVHQIFISSVQSNINSHILNQYTSTVRRAFSGIPYKLYELEELRDWIFSNYGSNFIAAFDKIRPFAFKADLARYLLLHKNGGWYFDISLRLMQGRVNVPEKVDFITFADDVKHVKTSFSCSNGIIYSRSGTKILQDCIEDCLQNIKREFYGRSPLDITGPTVLGKAIARNYEYFNIEVGLFIELTPSFSNKNRAFVFNNGHIFALHKQGNVPGDLKRLKFEGTNNYSEMYKKREVFEPHLYHEFIIFYLCIQNSFISFY